MPLSPAGVGAVAGAAAPVVATGWLGAVALGALSNTVSFDVQIQRGYRLVRMPLDFRITVDINVPADRVWAVIRDVESWPEWTPTVKKIRWLDKGSLAVGSSALIWQPKLLPAKWKVTELDDSQRSFTWETRGPGMRLYARHWVEGAGNTSRATLSIQFSGPLGPLFARLTRKLNDRYLALEAKGLRERSEGISALKN
ncbi:MAG: SRPBCC family protein [Bryobacteraceae bacterium]|jgi:uncharacterized membrane protein